MILAHRRTAALRALTAGVLALALAACGSSADDDDSSDLPGKPIKIMTIYSKAGPVALPEVPEGAVAAVRAINDGGGIDGRPLELIDCPDGNNANTAADCARRAIDEGVVALVGSASTYSTVFLPKLSKRKIASFGNIPAGVADFASTASFPITGGPPITFAALPRFLADDGAKKISLVRPDLAAAGFARFIADQGLRPKGIKIASEVPVPISAPDMSTYAAQALAGDVDGVVVILPGPQAVNFVQVLRETDPDIRVALASTDPGPVHEALGERAEGIIQALDTVPVPGTESEAAKRYEDEMKAAGFDDLSGYRLNSWLAVHVLARLLPDLPQVTAPAVWKKIEDTSGLKTGLMPPLQWKRGWVGKAPRAFNPCALASKLTASGEQEPVTGEFFDPFKNQACPTP
jgi:ABC-type branched-subunit amino acid transport system substrate-binding protein